MARQKSNKEIMDDLNGYGSSSSGKPQKWIESPYHPDGGYYVDDDDIGGADSFQRTKRVDEIERYLRS